MKHFFIAAATLLCFGVSTGPAWAGPSYEKLKNDGYTTSRMHRNKAGINGFTVSKGGRSYFCRLHVGVVYNNNDIVAGRPLPSQVRYCTLNKTTKK